MGSPQNGTTQPLLDLCRGSRASGLVEGSCDPHQQLGGLRCRPSGFQRHWHFTGFPSATSAWLKSLERAWWSTGLSVQIDDRTQGESPGFRSHPRSSSMSQVGHPRGHEGGSPQVFAWCRGVLFWDTRVQVGTVLRTSTKNTFARRSVVLERFD